MNIYRGDTLKFNYFIDIIDYDENGIPYIFQPGEKLIVFIKHKLNEAQPVIRKEFQVNEKCESVEIYFSPDEICNCLIGSCELEIKLLSGKDVYTNKLELVVEESEDV